MGDVVQFRRPRNGTIRGGARDALTQAMRSVGKPVAVVVVAMSADGNFAVRTISDRDAIHDFDMYSRASAVCEKERMELISER